MGILKSKDGLDLEKLNSLLKKRGHGIINPSFLGQCNEIFEGKQKGFRVIQCDCGEVYFMPDEIVEKIVKKHGSEELPCKRCGLYELLDYEGVSFEFDKINKHSELMTIIEKNILESDNPPSQELLKSINKEFNEFINAETYPELFYQLHCINKHLWRNPLIKKNDKYSHILNELVKGALRYKEEFEKVYNPKRQDYLQFKNTRMAEIQDRQYRQLREQAKFYNLPAFFDIERTHGVTEDELDVNSELNAYNHLVEEDRVLRTLFNLVKIAEGLPYSEKPFENEKVKFAGKEVAVKSLQQRVLAFNNYLSGQPFYYLLNDLLRNRLRNAHAHNDYEIDLAQNKIQYKDSISLDEFRRLSMDMRELSVQLFLLLQNSYFDMIPTFRHIKLGYDDPVIIANKLKPAREKTLAELHVEGYSFTDKNVPDIKILLNDSSNLMIATPLTVDEFYINEETMVDWLRQIKRNRGKLKVSFNNISDWLVDHEINERRVVLFDTKNRIEKIIEVEAVVLGEIDRIIVD